MRTAIVTLLIGDKIERFYREFAERSWLAYAQKHGLEIVAIRDFIDPSPRARLRSPHWQKCLIAEHPSTQAFDRLVWIDADVVINHHHAPDIIEAVAPERIGVSSYQDTARAHEEVYLPWNNAADPAVRSFANTRVLVLSRSLHGGFLRHVYETGIENQHSAKENIPLSYEIFRSGYGTFVDRRFNVPWCLEVSGKYPFLVNLDNPLRLKMLPYCIHAAWSASYFLHFVSDYYDFGDGRKYQTRDDVKWLVQEQADDRLIVFTYSAS